MIEAGLDDLASEPPTTRPAESDGDESPAIPASKLQSIEQIATNLEHDLLTLEREAWIATTERALLVDGLHRDLQEARRLAKRRHRVTERVRERADKLVHNFSLAPRFAEQTRKSVTKRRSLAGHRLITHVRLQPPVIRVAEHEACRIELGFSAVPTALSAYILERDTDGGAMKEFIWHAPQDRFQTGIWEGIFPGSSNQPPDTGTYRIHISAEDARGKEEYSDLIRVENDSHRTVTPRAESEHGERAKALTFNGSVLVYEDAKGKTIELQALSGLRPNNPHNKEKRDYVRPACQWVKNRGPLPARSYEVRRNVVQTPTLKVRGGKDVLVYPSGASESHWGPYRAPLHPSGVCGREAFFLHLDVADDGTAGCIGVQSRDEGKFNLLMKILMRTSTNVPVLVKYPPDTGDCFGLPTQCPEGASSKSNSATDALEVIDPPSPNGQNVWWPITTQPGWLPAAGD